MSMRSLDASAVLLVLVLGAGRAFAEGPKSRKACESYRHRGVGYQRSPRRCGLPVGSGTPAEAPRSMWRNARCATSGRESSAESPTPLIGGGPITDIYGVDENHLQLLAIRNHRF